MAAKDLELLYDIYFVGLPGHNTMQFNDEAEKDTEHKPLLRSLTSLVPEARVFEFTLFEAGPTSNKNALSANGFSNEAYRLLDAIREKTLSWNKWGTVLLVGYGLGGIIIKQALILANSNPRYYDVAVSTSDISGTRHLSRT
ncbi:uncharacterized protein F4807DRAFT_170772 [Annulohypoxylon truncatum]|uniref:uncharacterized protein n=1 Tax=Annulohypoxylon truncatum TaxID=327061 RepID=UPI002008893A|nr:uncharacterized protein F4807DRAFT_170772 [Annulohypoxylon truncatum]KAI1207923.1 hypothetical protein F4807DRAFT_170772 [Annulohypoxylon truncatum]